MFRSGVSTSSPEGLRWTAISTPAGNELTQLSVGPTGLVWGVLFNGCAIVRTGVTRDRLSGESWLDVKPPSSSPSNTDGNNGTSTTILENLSISQLSVGTNSVWCVTNDNRVWFRRGIKGEMAGVNENAAIGSGWVEMTGNISMVSVASNDQVNKYHRLFLFFFLSTKIVSKQKKINRFLVSEVQIVPYFIVMVSQILIQLERNGVECNYRNKLAVHLVLCPLYHDKL